MKTTRVLLALTLAFAAEPLVSKAAFAKPLDDDAALALAERIMQDDEADSKKALDELRKLGPQGVSDLLDAASEAEDDEIELLADAISELGKDALPELVKRLDDDDEDVRACVLWAFSDLDKDALPALVKVVKEGPKDRRDRAARLLADLDEEAVPALVALVKDGSKDVREAAAVALSTIGEASVKPLIALLPGAMKDVRETIRAILYSIAADDPELAAIVVKDALDLLKSKNSDVRCLGSVLVGKFGNADSMPAIIAALCASDDGIRRSVVACAVLLGEIAVPDLVHCLGAEDGKVADAATEALSYIGTAAVPALTRVMKAPVTQLRGCAICALGNMRHSPSTPAIIDALDDAEKDVRSDAQAALESITGQKLTGKPAWQSWWNEHKDDPEPNAGNPAPSSEKAGSKWPIREERRDETVAPVTRTNGSGTNKR